MNKYLITFLLLAEGNFSRKSMHIGVCSLQFAHDVFDGMVKDCSIVGAALTSTSPTGERTQEDAFEQCAGCGQFLAQGFHGPHVCVVDDELRLYHCPFPF